jgi:hypothetical protein
VLSPRKHWFGELPDPTYLGSPRVKPK